MPGRFCVSGGWATRSTASTMPAFVQVRLRGHHYRKRSADVGRTTASPTLRAARALLSRLASSEGPRQSGRTAAAVGPPADAALGSRGAREPPDGDTAVRHGEQQRGTQEDHMGFVDDGGRVRETFLLRVPDQRRPRKGGPRPPQIQCRGSSGLPCLFDICFRRRRGAFGA